MSATAILTPAAAAEAVCHEEQLRIWADDHVISALAQEGYFRDDLSYDDRIDIERIVMREIKNIIESAFDHPEARTIRRRPFAAPSEGRRGAADITAERQRQVTAEGWSPDHDDEHADHQIPLAALCYLYASIYDPGSFVFRYWPWDQAWWKPADARRNLVKAGALIAAEIDRLDRASQPSTDRGSAA